MLFIACRMSSSANVIHDSNLLRQTMLGFSLVSGQLTKGCLEGHLEDFSEKIIMKL